MDPPFPTLMTEGERHQSWVEPRLQITPAIHPRERALLAQEHSTTIQPRCDREMDETRGSNPHWARGEALHRSLCRTLLGQTPLIRKVCSSGHHGGVPGLANMCRSILGRVLHKNPTHTLNTTSNIGRLQEVLRATKLSLPLEAG